MPGKRRAQDCRTPAHTAQRPLPTIEWPFRYNVCFLRRGLALCERRALGLNCSFLIIARPGTSAPTHVKEA